MSRKKNKKKRQHLPNAPGKGDIQTVGDQNNAGQKEKEGGAAQVNGRTAAQMTPTPHQAAQPHKKWYKAVRWWKLWEGLGIAAVIGYAGITYVQWQDLRHNFEVDQRSWLRTEYSYPLRPNGTAKIRVTNTGKSPAMQGFAHAVYEIVDSRKEPSFKNIRRHTISIFPILFPGVSDSIDVVVYEQPDGPISKLTDADTENLASGKTYVAIYGQVEYIDQFGRHWTRFCDWKHFSAGGEGKDFRAGSCVRYNAVGDGRPPKD